MTDVLTLDDLQIGITVDNGEVYLNGTDLIASLTRYFLVCHDEAVKIEYSDGFWAAEGIRNTALLLLDALEATEKNMGMGLDN
jgi:hypothetical protein